MELTGTTNRFQHYELLRRDDGSPWELGRGTMGVTYKAFDVNLRCEVALKVVNPALIHHPNARERFIREARAAARLRHRNIASVYHLGNDGDRFFYAMEFIDGDNLDALVRRQGPLAPDAALRVLLQVARALAAAARQGVIHRDIKPGNLMVVHEDDDDHRVVKLIDFGLARANSTEEDAGNLTANGFVGTPVYSSPEQMAEKPADARSDIYSLGVTAWFLVAGKPPFNGTVASIFQQHATKPPPWEALPAGVPAPLRVLLARMLEKNPGRRPQSAVELRQEIEACHERLRAPSSPPVVPRPEPRPAPPAPGEPKPPAMLPRELGPGMILKGRYEFLRLAGEGNSGQVFQVRDRGADGETRALKVFRSELTDQTSKREIIADEVRLIHAAPHANLIRLYAFEHLGSRTLDFLVEEWLRGFTLLDLLAARGGALPVAEALQILSHAADAVDHAVGRNFDRLDLALHQLHVHFPREPRAAEDDAAVRDLMARPLAGWPRWTLKVNPLGAIHGGLESSTWAGELTHLPGATPALERDPRLDNQPATSAASYLRGLARAMYETLGGAPGMLEAAQDKRAKGASLPAVSEEANAVLRRAMSPEAVGYASCREFCAALAAATGNRLPPARTETAVPAAVTTLLNRDKTAKTFAKPPVRPPGKPVAEASSREGSVADLLGVSEMDAERASYAGKTSVWERLTLVSGGGRRDRTWLPTLAVMAALAVGSAVLAFAVLAHRNPGSLSAARAGKTSPAHAAAATPRSTPAAVKSFSTPQTVSNDVPARTPAVTPAPAADLAPPVTTPPPLPPTPAVRNNLAKVHVETHPSGAEIRLAGKLIGTTPLDVSLPAGDHQFSARYRNWVEVRHTLHLDADQLSAQEEIRMAPPTTMVPPADSAASPAPKKRPTVAATPPPRDTPRTTPIPSGNAIVHFPTPPGRGLEPFLAQPTPAKRNRPGLTPFDPDGTSDPSPRRRPTEPLQSDNGED